MRGREDAPSTGWMPSGLLSSMLLHLSRIVCASVPARTPRSQVESLRPLGVLAEGDAGDTEDRE